MGTVAAPRRIRVAALEPGRATAVRRLLSVLGVLALAAMFGLVLPVAVSTFGFDAHSYWGVPSGDLYAGTASANGMGVYRYAPVFVPVLALDGLLPWYAFATLWLAFLGATYLWLAGRWWAILLLFPPVAIELYMGNIHLLLAAAVVIGFRYPAAWAFVLLTKVTPGVGLLWFVVRREWRALAAAVGTTVIVVLVGLVLAPDAWRAWVGTLVTTSPATGTNHLDVPLPVRLVTASALVAWGAVTDRRWTVVVASLLALPTVWTHSWAMLVGLVPLLDPWWADASPAARLLGRLRGRRSRVERVAATA